jgi:hypothetical protein
VLHARLQLLLRVILGRVADEALLLRKLVLEVVRIRPVEREDSGLVMSVRLERSGHG